MDGGLGLQVTSDQKERVVIDQYVSANGGVWSTATMNEGASSSKGTNAEIEHQKRAGVEKLWRSKQREYRGETQMQCTGT